VAEPLQKLERLLMLGRWLVREPLREPARTPLALLPVGALQEVASEPGSVPLHSKPGAMRRRPNLYSHIYIVS
jgi:hypothetical protein